jgi:enoyl-CoA hydratase
MGIPALESVAILLDDAIATVMLNRPEQRNPLSLQMQSDLMTALRWATDATEVRVVVLTGAGEKAFSAGADLGSLNNDASELEKHHSRELFRDLLMVTQRLGKPLIGRINGHALAGGFGLACACDLLVAADTASFGTPEINVGLWPMMLQALMIRNLPRKVVLRMIMLGERWSAGQMQQFGFVSEVATYAELDGAVARIAGQLATKAPLAMKLGREAFYRQQDMELSAALAYLHASLSLVSQSDDAREGVAAFMEKRPPRFAGH